jgi:hypothetical protein
MWYADHAVKNCVHEKLCHRVTEITEITEQIRVRTPPLRGGVAQHERWKHNIEDMFVLCFRRSW